MLHTTGYSQFHPTDLSDLVFFVESKDIVINDHVAFCETNACLNHPNSEGASIIEQYCDVSNSCAEGCVRRWLDQSDYVPSGGFNSPEYTSGRNFGQDDSEKPCYISDCINGNPCVRGGGPYGSFTQDKYLEIQIADFVNLPDEFSIFLLAKPIDQTSTGDWFYFGQSNSFLRHDVANNKLRLRVPGNLVTSISPDNSIQLDTWQLIEIHRDATNKVTTYVNANEVSLNNVILPGNFTIGYLFSNFKTTGIFNATAMYGDIAGFLVYDRKTIASENETIRDYFNQHYLGGALDTEEYQYQSDIKITPNPFHHQFRIPRSPLKLLPTSLVLYNSIGVKMEFEIAFEGDTMVVSVDEFLPNGVYFFKVEQTIYKLVKE